MFERRLKIFLILIGLMAVVMVARAAQIQLFQQDQWKRRAEQSMSQSMFVETRRGEIQDFHGITLASDEACVDAAVDYRAIIKDADWIKKLAAKRLPPRADTAGGTQTRAELLKAEIEHVNADIDAMWPTLAKLSGHDLEDIEQTQAAIRQRVELRRKLVWYGLYRKAVVRHENEGPSPWYKSWLFDESSNVPQPDNFSVTVAEQKQTHVILRNVDDQTAVAIARRLDHLPGLELKESTHRVYAAPGNKTLCHSLGRMAMASKDDVKKDPNLAKDELRQYLPNDLMGKDGIEALAEPLLRGSKGRLDRKLGQKEWHEVAKAVPGEDVRLGIDIDLQTEITQAFHEVRVMGEDHKPEIRKDMHGAAVVIDVATNEVRALVSYPVFDLNRYDTEYQALAENQIDNPLMNRATNAQFPPGSTVKTIVGSVAVTNGKLGIQEGIRCSGYLVLPDARGHMIKHPTGRCWVASQWLWKLGEAGVAGHQVPYEAPHRGRFGNPDGSLVFADALERSCNVFFENVADRLQIDGVTNALSLYGLGRPTGLGISEGRGRIPRPGKIPTHEVMNTTWLAGIGQGSVTATPIQMANVAATLARRGIWMRPKLLVGQTSPDGQPDRVDLHMSAEAMDAVKEGMINVVNSPGGTGTEPKRDDMVVAAKTGSAQQTKWFSVLVKDAAGKVVRDKAGMPQRTYYPPGAFPWYQGVGTDGQHLAHAWFIGFAPAENPKIAFCVMVEYGGSGGRVAGPIVKSVIDACVEHKYLSGHAAVKLQPVTDAR